jgi:polar amino acid transport system substrate-binding protein
MRNAPLSRTSLLAILLIGMATPCLAAAGDFVSMNANLWPPYFLDDPRHPGFAREVLQICVPQAGYELRMSPVSIEKMYDGLRVGFLDAHVMSFDPKRASFLQYGKVPMFSDAYRPVVRAGSGLEIHSVADFDRFKTIGHLKGLRYSDAYHDYVEKRIQAGTAVQADTNDQLLQMLLAGKVDVYVNLAGTSRWLARQAGSGDKVTVLPFDVKRSDYFVAVSQKSTHIHDRQKFLDAIDSCLRQMEKDGQLQKLRNAYGLE